MAAINNLTSQGIQRIARASAEAPPEAPKKHNDGGGLFLLATPSGALLWRMKFRIAGVEKKLSFGAYPEVSLADARAARDEAKRLLAQGIDPGAEKQARKKAAQHAEVEKSESTFAHFAHEVLAFEAPRQKPQTKAKWELHMGYAIAEFGQREIAAITPPEVLAFLQDFQARAETMHSIKRKMSDVFRRAAFAGACHGDPTHALKDFLRPARSKRHSAIVEPARFGDLIRAIDGHAGHPSVRHGLLFLALTFQRPHMVREMQWAHVDWAGKRWNIPKEMMKGEEENVKDHVVPLSEAALEVLRAMQPISGNSLLVFPGRKHNQTLSDNTLNKAMRDRGIPSSEHVGHGFRASANTMIKEQLARKLAKLLPLGTVDLQELIDIQLAHVIGDETRRAYDRVQFLDERRVMMDVWAEFIEACRRRDPKVVKLQAVKA